MQGHDITFAPAMALNQADAALEEGLSKFETHPPTPRGWRRQGTRTGAQLTAVGGGGSSG